jgi:oligoribonuclease
MKQEDIRLVFLDAETTGLKPLRRLENGLFEPNHCLIEVAARVTDVELSVLGTFHALIRPALDAASRADALAMKMHRTSGLYARALESRNDVNDVDRSICEFLRPFRDKTLILTGNSVHFDRRFIEAYMPGLDAELSHRHLDVSAVRLGILVSTFKDPMTWKKNHAHTADADLDETILELTHYVQNSLG